MENEIKSDQNAMNPNNENELITFMQELQQLYPVPTLPEQLKKFSTSKVINESTEQQIAVLESASVSAQEASVPIFTKQKIKILLFGNRQISSFQIAVKMILLIVVAFILVNLIRTLNSTNLPVAAVSNACTDSSGSQIKAGTSENFGNPSTMPNLNMSQTLNGLTVIVHNVTADPNSINVYLTISDGTTCPNYDPFNVSLTDANGNNFPQLASSLGSTPYGQGGTLVFDSSDLSVTTQTLQLQLKIPSFNKYKPEGGLQQITTPFVFNFSAHFDMAQVHILKLNQTTTSGGITATLEKVVITPNQTRFYFKGLPFGLGYELTAKDFRISNDGSPSNAGPGTTTMTTTLDGQLILTLNYPLYDKYGDWSLMFKPKDFTGYHVDYNGNPSPTPVPGGPWTFHFTLSPNSN